MYKYAIKSRDLDLGRQLILETDSNEGGSI